MHWLLRFALFLNVALAISLSGMFAITAEERFPSGADAEFTISSATNADANTLAKLASQNGVSLAQATYASENGRPHRVITILTEGDGTEGGPSTSHAYPDYGFDASTQVQPAQTHALSPLGRWVAYGADDNIEQLVADLPTSGFTVFSGGPVGIGRLASDYFANPVWMVQLAGVAIAFVAALVSAQASTRIRAVGAMHGRPTSHMVADEIGRYSGYAAMLGGIGWLAWVAIGFIGWGGTQTFGFAGSVFTAILTCSVLGSVIACSLAVVFTAISVPGALDQIRGKKPLKLTYWAAAITLLITLSGAFVSLGYTQSAATHVSESRASAQRLTSSPEGFTISLWGSDEEAVHNILPDWSRFIDDSDRRGRLILTSFEPVCDSLDTTRPCVFVNGNAARILGIDEPRDGRVHISIPEADTNSEERLKKSLHEYLKFEHELNARDGIRVTSYGLDDIDLATNPDGYSVDINMDLHSLPTDGKVTDPVIIVVPVDAISANTHYSWTSLGFEVFSFPNANALTDSLHGHDADNLVAWVERPQDSAEARAIAATRELTQFSIVSIVTLCGVFTIGILLAIVYCEERRRPLFVQHLHGARLSARYSPYFAVVFGVGILGLILNPGSNATAWGMRLGMLGILSVAGAMTAYARDATLRSDSIKHP